MHNKKGTKMSFTEKIETGSFKGKTKKVIYEEETYVYVVRGRDM
jgi:hypothetical protein